MRTIRQFGLAALIATLVPLLGHAQAILSPSLLRQAGATNGQALCWSSANSQWQPCTISIGSVALDDLSDVAITGGSTGEVIRYNGSAWVDATLAFSDLSGAASDAQVPDTITINLAATATALAANGANCASGEAAGGVNASGAAEACLELGEIATTITNTYVPYVSLGFLVGDADMVFDGDKLTLGVGATKGLWFGDGDSGVTEQSDDILDLRTAGGLRASVSASVFDVQVPIRGPDGSAAAPGIAFRLDTDNGLFRSTTNNWGLAVGGTSFVELGGSQTLLVFDQTATTGDTTFVVKAGAAEAGNVFEVQSNAGSAVFGVDEAGTIATTLTASRCVETDGSGNLTVAAGTCGVGGGAPTNATYWVSSADATLSAEVVVDSLAALETAIGATNIIIAADIDASSEIAAIVGDETGSGALVFAASPTLSGTVTVSGDLVVTGSITAGGSGAALEITEQVAPGAGGSAGVHNVYIDSTSSRWSTHENGGSVVTYLAVQDQNAGTDVTADLEEETHASEHAENAADEILVENLGTACSSGQTGVSDGAGGLDCTAVAGSSYIPLYYWRSGIAITGAFSTTNFGGNGLFTSTTPTATSTNIQGGTLQFTDSDGEIAYFVGERFATEKVTASNLTHVNFESEISIQTSTAADTITFFLSIACVAPTEATNTAFTSISFTSLTSMTGTSSGTPGTLIILSSTDQDLSTPCAVGDVPVYKVEGDETSAGYDNTINFMTLRVWTD